MVLATVGALQAVYLLKSLVVQGGQGFQYLVLVPLFQHTFVHLLVFLCLFLPVVR
jgi:hypothetical protein